MRGSRLGCAILAAVLIGWGLTYIIPAFDRIFPACNPPQLTYSIPKIWEVQQLEMPSQDKGYLIVEGKNNCCLYLKLERRFNQDNIPFIRLYYWSRESSWELNNPADWYFVDGRFRIPNILTASLTTDGRIIISK